MAMGNEKVISKIKRLLALSSGNKNEHEAESALLKAQKIMALHNLELSDVEDLESREDKEAIHEEITDWSRSFWWEKELMAILAQNFRCHPYYNTFAGRSKLYVIGLKEDTEIVKELYVYALDAIKTNSTRYINRAKTEGRNTTGLKNDWIRGFLSGLKDRFDQQVESNNWSLALVKDQVVQDAINKMNFRSGTRSRVRTQHNEEAISSGYKKGYEFNTKGEQERLG